MLSTIQLNVPITCVYVPNPVIDYLNVVPGSQGYIPWFLGFRIQMCVTERRLDILLSVGVVH